MASLNPPACPHNRGPARNLRWAVNSRVVRRSLLLCVLALAAFPAVAAAFSARDLEGTWHGPLRQAGLKPFTVTVTIRSLHDSRRNPVRYSGLDCTGTWAFLGSAGGSLRFREVITAGKSDTCKGSGTVTLVPLSAGALRYRFSGGGISSAGVIRRVR
jgi:hypothetical protein